MGNQHSVPAGPKESLYEILAVEKNATDSELKKAYRKQALLLHPDRNFNQEEEATARFAKVQAAYDILSDPQERAWYDGHGTAGGAQEQEYGGNITTTDELKAYMDPEFYTSISKQADDFYDKIGQLFDQLKQEEAEAALDIGEDAPILGSFGDADSKFDRDVKRFYDSWSSFASLKSFAWEDVYRAWDCPDRRTRRAAEQHNKKIREAAKKEFNAAVRQLISLIKTKDPRVKQNNKKKQQNPGNQAAKEQARRDKQANAKQRGDHQEQDWAKVDDELDELEREYDTDEIIDLFECVVCDKVFKTKKQLTGHEASKKHAKAVAQLKREMRREGVELGFDDNISGDSGSENEKSGGEEIEAFPRAAPEADEADEEAIPASTSPSPSSATTPGADAEPETKPKRRGNQPNIIVESEPSSEDEDFTPALKREPISEDATLDDLLAQLESTRVGKDAQDNVQVKGKAKKKRDKKARQVNEFALRCSVCNTEFTSRNKLFDHVKASGHAAPVSRKKK